MKAKFNFFDIVATHVNSFLVDYQTDRPMVPFLCNDLAFLYCNLLMLFIRKSVLEDTTSLIKLSKVDPQSNTNEKQACDVDIGFGARSAVVEWKEKSSIMDTKLLVFQKECKFISWYRLPTHGWKKPSEIEIC